MILNACQSSPNFNFLNKLIFAGKANHDLGTCFTLICTPLPDNLLPQHFPGLVEYLCNMHAIQLQSKSWRAIYSVSCDGVCVVVLGCCCFWFLFVCFFFIWLNATHVTDVILRCAATAVITKRDCCRNRFCKLIILIDGLAINLRLQYVHKHVMKQYVAVTNGPNIIQCYVIVLSSHITHYIVWVTMKTEPCQSDPKPKPNHTAKMEPQKVYSYERQIWNVTHVY